MQKDLYLPEFGFPFFELLQRGVLQVMGLTFKEPNEKTSGSPLHNKGDPSSKVIVACQLIGLLKS
jgi:hypothetical protein